jgi:YbbR domain-containing protein
VAQVTGQPALGYVVAGVTVDPTQVSVVGNPSALENLTQLATDTVDVSGATSDVQKPVNIQAPSGTSVAGVQNATVTVLIRPIAASATLSAGPVLVGLPAADTANIAVSSVNVTVTGAAAALKNLQPSDLQVTLNVDKLAPGTHEVPVSVAAPSGITVSTITPATVRVTIIPPPTPTPTPTETASPTPTPTETPSPTSTPTVTGTPPTATPKPVPPTSTPSKG